MRFSKVLGLDLAYGKAGWAILDFKSERLLESGVIATKAQAPIGQNLQLICDRVERVVVSRKISTIAIEQPISYRSGTSTIRIAQVHGAVYMTLNRLGHPRPTIVNVQTVKKTAIIDGGARDKPAMIAAANTRWGVELTSDEADAAFVALTSIHATKGA